MPKPNLVRIWAEYLKANEERPELRGEGYYSAEPPTLPEPSADWCRLWLLPGCATLAALIAIAYIWRRLRLIKLEEATFGRLNKFFERDVQLKCYQIAKARAKQNSEKPYKKGYLLIGGFGDTPLLWSEVIESIDAAGHYYFAPRTPGWGRTSFEESERVRWEEWVMAARDGLTVVRGLCEEVTIVGHSTGALVAGAVLQREYVDRAVFTGPNFLPSPSDVGLKKIVLSPILGDLLLWLKVVPKKLRRGRPVDNNNTAVYAEGYYLSSFPVQAIQQMWKLQTELRKGGELKVGAGGVLILAGEHDLSVAPVKDQATYIRNMLPKDIPVDTALVCGAAHGLPAELKYAVDALISALLHWPIDIRRSPFMEVSEPSKAAEDNIKSAQESSVSSVDYPVPIVDDSVAISSSP